MLGFRDGNKRPYILVGATHLNQMAKFQVTFKGPHFDVTVAGDSAKELVEEYGNLRSELEKLLSPVKTGRSARKQDRIPELWSAQRSGIQVEYASLADLSIPGQVRDKLVEQRKKLTNWQTLFILLHYAPDGLTNREIRTLSEELGKRISYSWLDTDFHRRKSEGLVVSRRLPGSKETKYFLAEPGKKEALKLIQDNGSNRHE
jgi:hypothetical protein